MVTEEQVKKIQERIDDARKAINALYLVVDKSIAVNVQIKVELAITALLTAIMQETLENVKDNSKKPPMPRWVDYLMTIVYLLAGFALGHWLQSIFG